MPTQTIKEILDRLNSGDRDAAWTLFLEEHAALVLRVVRHFEANADDVSDCFQFICEQLVKDSFRRLRRFQPDGAAEFSTWLRAVVRNLCLDWHRKRFGRSRAFRSIERLSDLDQAIFRLVHEHGDTEQEAFNSLRSRFPELTPALVASSIERINSTLTPSQTWSLQARGQPTIDFDGHGVEIADFDGGPEAQAIKNETRAMLMRAVNRLPKEKRLLIRLRFEEELTLEQIARLLEFNNPQRVDREIKQILSVLRKELYSLDEISGKASTSSVKEA